jgi:hypothetical protein
MTFGRRRPGSPGDSPHVSLPWPKPRKGGPRGLHLSFRALVDTLEPPCVGSSSRGIGVPAADVPHSRQLRGASPKASSRRTGAAGCRFMFRPRGFAPPRRFAPRVSCGSVAPRNRSRVHRVSCVPAGRSPEGGQDAGISSRGAFRTLRRVPLVSSRKRITATVAFLPLPSCPVWGTGRSRSPSPTAIPADAGGVRPKNQPGEGHRAPKGVGPIRTDGASRLRRARGGRVRGPEGGAPKSTVTGVPRGGLAVPKSRWPASVEWGVPAVPGGDAPTPKSRESESGGTGEGGAPKSTVAGSRGPVAGAPKSLRGLVARAPKSRGGQGPVGVGPLVRRPVGPPRWRGSTPSGRVVPAEPGPVVEAPKSRGGEPGMTGVRARRLGTGCEEEIPMR